MYCGPGGMLGILWYIVVQVVQVYFGVSWSRWARYALIYCGPGGMLGIL